jgi:hypothetical protein
VPELSGGKALGVKVTRLLDLERDLGCDGHAVTGADDRNGATLRERDAKFAQRFESGAVQPVLDRIRGLI